MSSDPSQPPSRTPPLGPQPPSSATSGRATPGEASTRAESAVKPIPAPPLWSALIVDVLILLVLLLMLLQNSISVQISFFFLRLALPLGVVILFSTVWGGLVGGVTMALVTPNGKASAVAARARPALSSALIADALILVVLLVLLVQNTGGMPIALLALHVQLSLGVVIVFSVVCGGLLGGVTMAAVRGSSNAKARTVAFRAKPATPIGYTDDGKPIYPEVGYTPDGSPVTADRAAGYQPINPRTNSLAVVALVLGLVFPLLAIPFGHIARAQIRRTGEQGGGMALAGLILGYLGIVWMVIFVIAIVVAVQSGY